MRVRLVRHATLSVELAGRRLLVDPMLDEPGARPPVANTANDLRNPLVPLPVPVAEVVDGVDAVLVTHLHADHLDDVPDHRHGRPPAPLAASYLLGRELIIEVLPVGSGVCFQRLTGYSV